MHSLFRCSAHGQQSSYNSLQTCSTCRSVHLLRPAVRVPHTQGFQIYCSPVRVTGLTARIKSLTSKKNPQISPKKVSRKKKRGCLRKPKDVTVVVSQNSLRNSCLAYQCLVMHKHAMCSVTFSSSP